MPELLAPAGELKSAIGAINAGADAVYLGAPSFSARAYAKNLTTEEIVQVISYAHFWNRKVYLALNTLLKDREIKDAVKMLQPLYEAGLDAVIVQDLGLLSLLHQFYPEMEIHASTQMAVLSKNGVEFLKNYGVSRVVPGRELSIEEIRNLKKAGLELECFIHGAMCYSYSGKCLLSSMAGGRSGNRGRCAGPCRKEYTAENGKKGYFLSMKDMCLLTALDGLVNAGVDSLKIEGRMKNPAYSAGVTAIYRKYLERMAEGKCEILPEDLDRLKNIYIRSEIQEGYGNQYNGKDMISVTSPSYKSMSEELQQEITEQYIDTKRKKDIVMSVSVYAGAPISVCVSCEDKEVLIEGAYAETAQKKALLTEDILKQMQKTGNTLFQVSVCDVYTDEESFVPVSVLNEIRRTALTALEDKFLKRRQMPGADWETVFSKNSFSDFALNKTPELIIGVKTPEQYNAVFANFNEIMQNPQAGSGIGGIILPLMSYERFATDKAADKGIPIFIRMPEVVRECYREGIIKKLEVAKQRLRPEKIYCASLDALGIAKEYFDAEQIVTDNGVYVFNRFTEEFVLKNAGRYTVSYEWNEKELQGSRFSKQREMVIYGYIPVMYSANCIAKTAEKCNKSKNTAIIKDEMNHRFVIQLDHTLCTNTMYNCVPLSLLQDTERLRKIAAAFRMEFSVESEAEAKEILTSFSCKGEVTKGHLRRGVE